MKLSKNAITVIISTVVLLVCVAVSYAESKSEEGHTVIITPNQSQTSKEAYSEALNERAESTTVSAKTQKSKRSKSSKTTAQKSLKTSVTTVTFSFPADINTADFDMLCAVNGIGEVTANNILSYRQSIGGFKSMYDLLNVSGIGEKKLADLMRYFYVANDTVIKTTSQTTASKNTQTSKTMTLSKNTYKTVKSTSAYVTRVRKMVNINKADAKELEESLLISREMAEEIVEVRGLISGYTNIRELLMVKDFTESLLVELDEYLLL